METRASITHSRQIAQGSARGTKLKTTGHGFRGNVSVLLVIGIVLLALCFPVYAQQGGAAYYRYDANGRLIGVLSPTGEAVTYNYDPAGNFTSITRFAANQLSIMDFTPSAGGPTTLVTIYGTGFSSTPSANTVKFNGVTATVSVATNIRLEVQVPAGATTGPISITNANGTFNSSRNFYVPVSLVEFNKSAIIGDATGFTFNKTVNRAPLVNVGLISFDAIAGQRISVFIDQIVLLPGIAFGGYSPYAQVSIISPSSNNLATFPIQDYTQYTDYFGYLDPVLLPESGTYTILIDPNNNISTGLNQTGAYAFGGTVRLYDVSDLAGTISVTGQPTPVNFNAPGQNATYTFAGVNGQRIYLQAVQDGGATQIDTTVKLFAPGTYPNGTALATRTLGADIFVDTTTLTANGTYTILIDPQLNKTRAVTLNLYDVPPDVSGTLTIYPPTPPPPQTTVTIPSVGQAANLTFSVSGSQQVTIHIRNLVIGGFAAPTTLTLSTQGGTQIFSQTINSNGDYDIQQSLPAAGTYVLKIDPQKAATGSLNLYLTTP